MTNKSAQKKSKRGKKQNFVTIYDIAKYTGVSKSTVSRVVNGEGLVRPATRDLVHKAIKTLRFTPNRAARSLSSQTEIRIGLIYNNPSVAYFSELLIGALEGSGRHGAQLVVNKCEVGNVKAAYKAVRNLVNGGLNGIILTAPLSEETALVKELTEAEVAIVGVGTDAERRDISCIGIDDCKAAYEMTNYLIGLGHKRFGFVKGHPSHVSSRQRLLGFKNAMRDAGYKIEKNDIVQGFNSYRSGLEAGGQLLSGGAHVTVIFASNDDMASGVMAAAHRKGLNVPQNLSVVGFDDTIASSTWPELTTVSQHVSEIGASAVDLILQNIRSARSGAKPKPCSRLTGHKLVIRESAAAPQKTAAARDTENAN